MSESEHDALELAFRRFVYRQFEQAISDEERLRLVYIRLYPLREKYRNATTLDLLSRLETDGLFGPTNLEGLQELARDIGRKDLEKEAKEFAKRRSKEEKKTPSRPKRQPPVSRESNREEDIRLKESLEIIIGQMSYFARQVEVLKEAIEAGKSQRAKVSRYMQDSQQTAEKLAKTLNKAFCELETDETDSSGSESVNTSPVSTLEREQHHTHYENTSVVRTVQPVQEQTTGTPSGPPPKPKPRPRKESTASHQRHMLPTEVPAQETEPPLMESLATAAIHSPIAVRQGCHNPSVSSSPRPPVAVKPKRYRHVQQNGDNLAANTINIAKLPTPTTVKRAVGIYCPHTRLPQDFSSESGHAQQSGEVEYDYLDVTGSRTDDSGFEEPNQWKQHMSNPPPDQIGSTEEPKYYKSLLRAGMEEEEYTEVKRT